MNQEIFSKVKDFRTKLNLPVFSKAHLLDPVDISFYARFLMEELSELMKAHEKNNLVDGAHHMGVNLPRILEIVHEANMQKEPGTTSRGYLQDAIKPAGWSGPEDMIALELLNQCR